MSQNSSGDFVVVNGVKVNCPQGIKIEPSVEVKFKCDICNRTFSCEKAVISHLKACSKKQNNEPDNQAKRWCFTLNNYTIDETENLTNQNYLIANDIEYIVYGFEIAPTTLTPHLQGFVSFNEKKRISALKKFNSRAHWIICNGSVEQNINYCKKINQTPICEPNKHVFEWGVPPLSKKDMKNHKQSPSVTINTIIDAIKGDSSDLELMKKFPEEFWNKTNAFNSLIKATKEAKLLPRKLENPPEVHYIYGKTGTGKSLTADRILPDADHVNCKNDFWIGYNGSKNIILNDLRGSDLKFSELLKLLDRHPYVMNIKGGQIHCQAERIIITSSCSPSDLYSERVNDYNDNIDQLLRRISVIAELTKDGVICHHNILHNKVCNCEFCETHRNVQPPNYMKNADDYFNLVNNIQPTNSS